MKKELEICPKCHTPGVSPWAPFFASWPFSARCKSCGAKLRVRMPHWQNFLVQVLGQLALWASMIYGLIVGSLAGGLVGLLVGVALAFLIAMVPGLYAKLEVLPK